MIRIFIMPLLTAAGVTEPKYANEFPAAWASMTYGASSYAIVAAQGDETALDTIAAYTDVVAADADLDANVPQADLGVIQAALESMRIPADWMNPSMTWRQALRTIAGMFQFAQRYNGQYQTELVPETGYSLNDRWADIPANIQTQYLDTAATFGWDVPTPSDNTSIRQIMKALSDLWGDQPFHIGITTF